MINHVLLQKGSKHLLLTQYPDRYLLVAVDRKLTWEAEQQLLSSACSPQVLREMGLTCQTIAISELRGVALSGGEAGDTLVLYTKANTLKYRLGDDYEGGDIEEMFPDIPRFQPPKKSGNRGAKDWRIPLQTESGLEKAEQVALVLNLLGVGCGIGTLVSSADSGISVFWLLLSLGVVGIILGIYLRYPQYFSIMGSKEFKRARYTAKVRHLECGLFCSGVVPSVRGFLELMVFDWSRLLLIGAVLGILLTIALYFLSRETRENTGFMLAVAMVLVLVSCGFLAQVNHLANPGKMETQVAIVQDTWRSGGRHTSYDCTVLLPAGEEMELSIGRQLYNTLQPGDPLEIYVGDGAFGIRYGFVVGD